MIRDIKIDIIGTGPGIEITFDDDSYVWITSGGRCGMPSEEDWIAEHYNEKDERIEMYEEKINLWAGTNARHETHESEYAPMIMSEMLKWGSGSYKDGCGPEEAWELMVKGLEPNLGLLTAVQRAKVKELFKENVITT